MKKLCEIIARFLGKNWITLEWSKWLLDNNEIQIFGKREIIMTDNITVPLTFTDAAANKVKNLISEEENTNLKLRVYITGGGCSGFQYGFTFDEKVNEGDLTIEKSGVQLVIDPMSLQYLIGGTVDYTEGLEGSRFTVNNPNATSTCGCGSSFSI